MASPAAPATRPETWKEKLRRSLRGEGGVVGQERWLGVLLILPALILLTAFFLVPLVMVAWMSLHNWPLLGRPRFIGLRNYATMLTDTGFWHALWFSAKYTIVVTIAIFAVAFPLAFFVERPRPFVGFFRTAFFLPVVLGLGSASLLWVWLSNVDFGLFSPALMKLGLIDRPVSWLMQPTSAFISIIVMVVWKASGTSIVLLLTGLQAIPPELKEAASIDGARGWQRFRYITFPLIRRTFALALILSVTHSVLAFDQFYIITAGGPDNSMLSAVYWIMNTSFISFKLGYGAALSIALLALLVVLSIVQLYLLRTKEGQ
jgi:multiple sugar transport system permease protein